MKRIIFIYTLILILVAFNVIAKDNAVNQLSDIPDSLFTAESNHINQNENHSESTQTLLIKQDMLKMDVINLKEKIRLCAIICVSLISIIGLFIVIYSINKLGGEASDIVNASGLNFIVFGTIILVTVADTDQQLTAAMGVLGAIAGYLFGTMKGKTNYKKD